MTGPAPLSKRYGKSAVGQEESAKAFGLIVWRSLKSVPRLGPVLGDYRRQGNPQPHLFRWPNEANARSLGILATSEIPVLSSGVR